jgi:stage V sporulation protein G
VEITEVRVYRTKGEGKVRAKCSVVLDGEMVVHDLRVVDGANGLFVSMPSKKLPDGDYRDLFHPITAEARQKLHDAVLQAFHQSELAEAGD